MVPTDEERVFVEDVAGILTGAYDVHTKFSYTFQTPDYRNTLRDKAFEKECAQKPGLADIAANPPHRAKVKQ